MPMSHPQSRRTILAVVLATLAVLGLLVAGLTLRLRQQLRAEVLQREAEAIHAVASMEIAAAEGRTAGLNPADAALPLFAAVLESSRLRGVMAVQLFDAAGALREALPEVGPVPAAARWWPVLPERPATRYHPHGALEEVFGAGVEPGGWPTRVPLVEIVVPLRAGRTAAAALGAARYWIDGAPIAAEFARMDWGLFWQAALGYGGGAALVVLVLLWALARLAAQSADLARANRELDFAAKTGALGAISAHLIHGLKNPLAGLEGFVSDPELARQPSGGEAWQAAIQTSRRLRELVQEVTSVLRDEAEGGTDHRVPVAELLAAAQARTIALARNADVQVSVSAPADLALAARPASLAGLVLANLIVNAIEASARQSTVAVWARAAEGQIEFLVEDSAGGLPPAVRTALFQPVSSTKRHGGGVGLAISRRLARHAGGELELLRSDARGTVFCLRVPAWKASDAA